MQPVRSFAVFGEAVEILIDGEMTGGLSTTLTQVSPPGGGPPPHLHQNEDETFFVLEGEVEFLHEGNWIRRSQGQTFHSVQGSTHTFRNPGTTDAKVLVFVAPSGLEKYLEEISVLSMPQDAPKLMEISARYGISYPQ